MEADDLGTCLDELKNQLPKRLGNDLKMTKTNKTSAKLVK